MNRAATNLPEGLIQLGDKTYPTWPYVLNAAHEKGLCRIQTEAVQLPTPDNGMVAIVKAVCSFSAEKFGVEASFEAYGDASPRNVNSRIVEALLRMAETRAKGRACRDGCNIGQTMAEELPEEERGNAPRNAPEARTAPSRARHDPEDAAGDELGTAVCEDAGCGILLTADEILGCRKRFGSNRWCTHHGQAHLKAERQAASADPFVEA